MNEQKYQIICLNGHQKTDRSDLGTTNLGFCEQCGEKLINQCPSCGRAIPGYVDVSGIIDLSGRLEPVPKYCANCGKPYPWTQTELKAADELIELSELSDSDKSSLKDSIPDILVDTPRTKVAATKFKIYASKTGKVIGDGLRDVFIDLVSETAKKNYLGILSPQFSQYKPA